jgi:hypothetical protein
VYTPTVIDEVVDVPLHVSQDIVPVSSSYYLFQGGFMHTHRGFYTVMNMIPANIP